MRQLRHTYASKSNALRAARSEYQRMKRGVESFSIDLARGRADIYPEQHATVSGFKRDIDGEEWIVVRVESRVDENAFTTTLMLECKPAGVDNAPDSEVSDP